VETRGTCRQMRNEGRTWANTAASSRLGARRDDRPAQCWGALSLQHRWQGWQRKETPLTAGRRWSLHRLGAEDTRRRGRGSRRRGPGSASTPPRRRLGAAPSNGSAPPPSSPHSCSPTHFPLLFLRRWTGMGKTPSATWLARGARPRVVGARSKRRGSKDTARFLVGWRGRSSDMAAKQ
jgi:hypothetical protein